MSTLPKAQYQLPPTRLLADLGDYYLFGSSLAKKDLTPLGFDRQLRETPTGSSVMPLGVLGQGCSPLDSTARMAGASALSGLGSVNGVFTSLTGTTAGRKFRFIGAHLFEIGLNGVPSLAGTPSVDEPGFNATFGNSPELYEIFAESTTSFFVLFRSSTVSSTLGPPSISKTAMFSIPKTNFKASYVGLNTLGNISSGSGTSPGSVSGSEGLMTNRAFRRLAIMPDGRHLFLVCPIQFVEITNNTVAGNSMSFRYQLVDPASGAVSIGAANSTYATGVNGQWIHSIPSEMFADPSGNTLGSYYWFRILDGNSISCLRFIVPTSFTATPVAPAQSSTTLEGMPEGYTLVPPGSTFNSNNYGQISTLSLEDGEDKYLVYYAHSRANPSNENNGFNPVDRCRMVIFHVNPEDLSKLTYVSHSDNAFDYGQPLTDFVTSADKKTIVVFNSKGFGILTWSSDAKRYIPSPFRAIPSQLRRLALDTQGQIWIEDDFGQLYVFNLDLSASVETTFEGNPQSLMYTGTTIEQKINVSVYNFVGERISRSVRIQLRGATFSDGTTAKQVLSLANGPLSETLFVNGSGNLGVDAYLL